MAALHINPPENFTFSTPCNWPNWKMRFERYRIASGLSTKTGNGQIFATDPKAKFPELFKGLGVMKGCYSIKLKPGANPFAITSPRRVPIPLLYQTEAELERMVKEKVITPVLKPTEWCAPVVIVPKSDGNVRICVDLEELNKNVMRELHPLPKAEYSLNLLAGAKLFLKLYANSGF
ncbi:hypothetical protein AVEN_266487-1 [Araneus ventricosus]|uniref:Transposon Ty3-I Gag-Pol polyprotein n=1 Tax=Araneus ventricosus TaxID=182803 RepID=A0A4Y2E264_ARAVE|nr:hypothetical protein AVEN_266487-1 [Araneus ventricosus]